MVGYRMTVQVSLYYAVALLGSEMLWPIEVPSMLDDDWYIASCSKFPSLNAKIGRKELGLSTEHDCDIFVLLPLFLFRVLDINRLQKEFLATLYLVRIFLAQTSLAQHSNAYH